MEYVFVPVTCALTRAVLKEQVHERCVHRAISGCCSCSSRPLTGSYTRRDQEWCDTHRLDVGGSALGKKGLDHFHVIGQGRA
jgi:hypothetical protein